MRRFNRMEHGSSNKRHDNNGDYKTDVRCGEFENLQRIYVAFRLLNARRSGSLRGTHRIKPTSNFEIIRML